MFFISKQKFGSHKHQAVTPIWASLESILTDSLSKLSLTFQIGEICPGGDNSVSRSSLINDSQNAKLSTKFSTLNKDFSEMRKFQAKPLKPRCDICLKTPNPEGFWITPKTRQDILIRLTLFLTTRTLGRWQP